jgi:hypothetical protein
VDPTWGCVANWLPYIDTNVPGAIVPAALELAAFTTCPGAAAAGAALDRTVPLTLMFLQRIKTSAEQLTQAARWKLILCAAFQHFLRGRVLGGTGRWLTLKVNCRF